MLRFRQIRSAAAAKSYFKTQLSLGDYYVQQIGEPAPEEQIGQWGGRIAEQLGLEGEVTQEAFYAVIDNQHPDSGERLTLRQNANRRPGWDITFNWPKSASELYALTGDERIMQAALSAMRETMEHDIQSDLGVRLRGKQSKPEGNVEIFKARNGAPSAQTASGIWAEFTHLTGRPVHDHERGFAYPDMNVHHHVVLANITYNPWHRNRDGSLGAYMAVDPGRAKARARLHEASFHLRFADEMARLGYGVEPQENGYWEVAGWTRERIEKFSRRQSQIEEKAAKLGITNPNDKAELAAKTRRGKDHGLSWTTLKQIWHENLTKEEYEHLVKTHQGAVGERAQSRESVHDVIRWVMDHVFERESSVEFDKFKEDIYRRAFGIAGKAEVDAAIRQWLDGGGDGLVSAVIDGKEMVTWERLAIEEAWMLDFARNGRGEHLPLGPADYEWQTELFRNPETDTEEQEQAVTEILQSPDRVTTLRGGAGSGKTSLMQEAVAGINAGGREVHVFAPTAKAARKVLREEGFEKADTIAQLLNNEEMQQSVKDGVIWVDEAGMVGNPTMARIFRVAEKQNCRVVLSGDKRQHEGVETGNPLARLEDTGAVKIIELNTIRRQKDEAYREAVAKIARGEVLAAVDDLDQLGAIEEIKGRKTRHRRVARDFADAVTSRNRKGRLASALVVAPTHKEGDAVNEEIRRELRERGLLEGEEREYTRLVNRYLTEAQRRRASSFHERGLVVQFHRNTAADEAVNGRPFFNAGGKFSVVAWQDDQVYVENRYGKVKALPLEHADRFSVHETRRMQVATGDKLKITRNYSKLGLNNGQVVDVTGFTEDGKIRLRGGKELEADFGNLAHGYVSTSHSSQGQTVDQVFIAQGAESFGASSREQFYVSVSRGREAVHIYTDDRAGLMERVGANRRRVSALEVVEARRARDRELQRRNQDRARHAVARARTIARDGGKEVVLRASGAGAERYTRAVQRRSRQRVHDAPVQDDQQGEW